MLMKAVTIWNLDGRLIFTLVMGKVNLTFFFSFIKIICIQLFWTIIFSLFHFGNWGAYFCYNFMVVDVIEENAMNEKYCVQVLKILIRKADADIDDLEENLVLLQCDLAWTESRNQFEACCTALREKIDILDHSMNSWRQSDKINTNDQSPLHRQPAEKLCEILKPFLGDGREQDDGQVFSVLSDI